ncbi:MAG: hypothetical protein Q8S14_06950 [Algoriphagus sp.]|uniref:hypothetical protein n=1 Tax=Algoriphagus sp. TaxID=1872435 RepID=UPI00273396C1|nr:hypothetical protein [Algoriphagus sp.]MDP3471597.1 hypothetical protein [Algoriphagus sp.]
MTQILFHTTMDVNNNWLFYIENEAKSLAQRDDFAIINYLDREIFNPEMEEYLTSDDLPPHLDEFDEGEVLSLNLTEGMKLNLIPEWLRRRFRKLKAMVKKIFCHVVHGIGDLDTKAIISAVLLAVIPAFTTGLPAAVLPIIIGLVAYLLKFGIEKTCPL